ncbi:hypothetical protein ACFQMM_17595 [Saliphagus sp. GCM10025308]
MTGFANSGRMLPEQVWDSEAPTEFGWTFGSGTAAATPLPGVAPSTFGSLTRSTPVARSRRPK